MVRTISQESNPQQSLQPSPVVPSDSNTKITVPALTAISTIQDFFNSALETCRDIAAIVLSGLAILGTVALVVAVAGGILTAIVAGIIFAPCITIPLLFGGVVFLSLWIANSQKRF